jgi:hypothetical protein
LPGTPDVEGGVLLLTAGASQQTALAALATLLETQGWTLHSQPAPAAYKRGVQATEDADTDVVLVLAAKLPSTIARLVGWFFWVFCLFLDVWWLTFFIYIYIK